ncbi:uncharacterized protein ACJ7VT_013965 [Polymixia lowei]
MSVILCAMGLSLLIQGCLSTTGETERGCAIWDTSTIVNTDVCCSSCLPGNRRVKDCGPDPKDLCTPCEPDTYTLDPTQYSCASCTQCVGALVLVKACTSTTDTVCGCTAGLRCGDNNCSFCVKECGNGEEPEKRSCKKCENGTFNDQIHQKCKPWRTSCPLQGEVIVANGDAFSDSKCSSTPIIPSTSNTKKVPAITSPTKKTLLADQLLAWPLILCAAISMILIAISIKMVIKITKKRKMIINTTKKTPIISSPTASPPCSLCPSDLPRTLIAVECSYHEAQQEQGGSSESLDSKDSEDPLIV